MLRPFQKVAKLAPMAGLAWWALAFGWWWDRAPRPIFSLVLLVLVLLPAGWLAWHTRRIEQALITAPGLVDDATRALEAVSTQRAKGLLSDVRQLDGKLQGAPWWRQAWHLARFAIKPLRDVDSGARDRFTDLIATFSPLFFGLSGAAFVATVFFALTLPLLILLRLVVG